MRPLMDGIHSAETDCIPHLTGLELAKGESNAQNGSSTFLPQDPCWDPHPWHHSSDGGDRNYGTSRLQWHLKSSPWDYSISGDPVVGSIQGNDWGTHNEGFILGGVTGAMRKGIFSPGRNGCSSHFLPSVGFASASMAGNNDNGDRYTIRSSPSPSEPELKPLKGWLEQSCEVNLLELRKTESKLQLERERQVEEEQKHADAEEMGNCELKKNGGPAGDASMGLRLGKRTYYEDSVEGGLSSRTKGTSSAMPGLTTVKKQRMSGAGVRCQVDGCKADLSECKDYHRRHKVCAMHSKAPNVIWKGKEHRFCQQCSRFHELKEFDESKRSCRRRLADHNERRRRPAHDTSAMVGAVAPINQDRNRSALTSIMERSYFVQHPALSVTPVLDGSEAKRRWAGYEYRAGDNQISLACRMQVLNINGGGGASSSPSPTFLSSHHLATTVDRLHMMLQPPNKPSTTRETLLQPYHDHHQHSFVGRGLTLSSTTGISADCGRALSLLSSQTLPASSNADTFINQDHEFIDNNHACGVSTSAQPGFSAGGGAEGKMYGVPLTGMGHHHHYHHNHHDNKEQEDDGSLVLGLGDPMLAQLLQGQDFRCLDTQQVSRTLDLMQLPASHPHQMRMGDGNVGVAAFAELQSLGPYENSIFEQDQQLI